VIPVTKVAFGPEEENLVLEVLRSGQLAQGEYVERFERMFAELHGSPHAIAVNNGTTALVAALQALDLGPGDEVITSPFTFVATLNAILEAGATARFADISDDFTVRPDLVAGLVNERTRVLMPVHLYGYVADMDPLVALAQAQGLGLVEDAAQAVGARYRGRSAGSFGLGCFSFYATKNISTGEGGVITTGDDALADRLRLLRNQGMRARYQYELAGHNYRMTNVGAAIGLPQLARLGEISAQRRANAEYLQAGLSGIPGLLLPPEVGADRVHAYHQYTVRVTSDASVTRDGFIRAMAERGVGSGVYYPRVVFDYDCYRHDSRVVAADVPHAERIASEVVSLPVHPHLTVAELEQIVEAARCVLVP